MTVPSATSRTNEKRTAFFGNQDLLRAFIEERYGDNPPQLVWVAGVPADLGGGVRYTYSDGSAVEAHGGSFLWDIGLDDSSPVGEWDPIR